MPTLSIEISDDLMEQLAPIRDQPPDLLHQCLQPAILSAQAYRYVYNFLSSQPTAEQIAAFRSTPEMQQRLAYLLDQNSNGKITPEQSQELDEYERIEHLIILLKAGNLPALSNPDAAAHDGN